MMTNSKNEKKKAGSEKTKVFGLRNWESGVGIC